MFGMQFERR